MTDATRNVSIAGVERPLQILIVEDNADSRESLEMLLSLCGHEVETAEDGVQGLEKALALRPEVVLLDIGLPRLDGLEVARRLRASLGRQVRLLACTAYSAPEDQLRARTAGCEEVLVKPLDFEPR